MNIIPAIIANDFNELKSKAMKVVDFVDWIQIDIMDGSFVPFKTEFLLNNKEKLNINIKKELHLMVNYPERYKEAFFALNPEKIILHFESKSEKSILNLKDYFKKDEILVYLAFKMDTEVQDKLDLISNFDGVQLMSIERLGSYGQKFTKDVIPKIEFLRSKFSDMDIEIDGGVNLENAKILKESGATSLAVGSAIFKSKNIKDTIKKLQQI